MARRRGGTFGWVGLGLTGRLRPLAAGWRPSSMCTYLVYVMNLLSSLIAL
jgi:hypothetical protein